MVERTHAERNWETARQEEQQPGREPGETFRPDPQWREGYREGSVGGGYQPRSYEQLGGRGSYAGGWQAPGPSDYSESTRPVPVERGYGRPPAFRYQLPGYAASANYNAELEAGEWGRPPAEFRPGSYGPRGREVGAPRGGMWGPQWRGDVGGWAAERLPYGGGWRAEALWEQDREFGEEGGGWGTGAGFPRGGFSGGYPGQARGGGFARWPLGEGGWRGGAAPGYPVGGWGRGYAAGSYGEGRPPEWAWPVGYAAGGFPADPGWAAEYGGYGYGARPGWPGGLAEWESGGAWGARGAREWGEGGRSSSSAYGDPWSVPGPFAGRGPQGYQRSGDSIRDDVCERLTRHGHIDASGIRVRVENADVVLEGTVPDRPTKRLAEDVAEAVSGVHDVQNRLRVSERDESRGISASAGARGDERDNRNATEIESAAAESSARRPGRPERDAERQKATARSKG